jgi:hypothetical protein
MVPILIGAFAIAGVGVGWVGYKANKRIAAWGHNMNACDDIFRMAGEGEGEGEQPVVRTRAADDVRVKAPFGSQHLPTGPAPSR